VKDHQEVDYVVVDADADVDVLDFLLDPVKVLEMD